MFEKQNIHPMSSKFDKQIHNLYTSKELLRTLMKEAKKPRVDLVFPNQENLDSLFLEIDLLNFEILRRITSSNDKMLKIVTTNC